MDDNVEKAKKPVGKLQQSHPAEQALVLASASVFPNPELLFTPIPRAEDIAATAIYVFDTSAMLEPFDTGRDTLEELAKVMRGLTGENRLVVPLQAAREYARRKPAKVAELIAEWERDRSSVQLPKRINAGPLNRFESFKKLNELVDQAEAVATRYSEIFRQLMREARALQWTDPLTELFQSISNQNTLVASDLPLSQLQDDYRVRCNLRRPPGYNDLSKFEGIGDLDIWHTILKVGKARQLPVIFVTQDLKDDWVVKSSFMPKIARFELVVEFQAFSEQRFALVDLVGFLRMNKASSAAITELSNSRSNEKEAAVERLLGRFLKNCDGVLSVISQTRNLVERYDPSGINYFTGIMVNIGFLRQYTVELFGLSMLPSTHMLESLDKLASELCEQYSAHLNRTEDITAPAMVIQYIVNQLDSMAAQIQHHATLVRVQGYS